MSFSETLKFPCSQCGACCRNVHLSEVTAYLDRGDGICHHYDLNTHLCLIYETRPEICRVGEYYNRHLKDQYSWDDFVKINLIVCEQLVDK